MISQNYIFNFLMALGSEFLVWHIGFCPWNFFSKKFSSPVKFSVCDSYFVFFVFVAIHLIGKSHPFGFLLCELSSVFVHFIFLHVLLFIYLFSFTSVFKTTTWLV